MNAGFSDQSTEMCSGQPSSTFDSLNAGVGEEFVSAQLAKECVCCSKL